MMYFLISCCCYLLGCRLAVELPLLSLKANILNLFHHIVKVQCLRLIDLGNSFEYNFNRWPNSYILHLLKKKKYVIVFYLYLYFYFAIELASLCTSSVWCKKQIYISYLTYVRMYLCIYLFIQENSRGFHFPQYQPFPQLISI